MTRRTFWRVAAVAALGLGAGAQTLTLAGSGAFAPQPAGTASPLRCIYLENSGSLPLTVTDINAGPVPFAIYSTTSLPAHLNPGEATCVTLSFTPPAAGSYSGQLQATLAGGTQQSVALSGSGTGTAAVAVAPALPLVLGQPVGHGLAAAGGEPPYRWSLDWRSAPLPPGVSLTSSGQLQGMPTAAGTYTALVVAADSSPDTLYGTAALTFTVAPYGLDAYGGLLQQPCPAGAQPHFTTALIGNRWWLCTPAGHGFWMRGVYNVAANDDGTDYQGVTQTSLIGSKYLTGSTTNPTFNWSLQSVRRLQAWGFNTLGEYATGWTLPVGKDWSWNTSDGTIPAKLPFVGFVSAALYSLRDSGNYAPQGTKDLIAGVKTSVYAGYRSSSPDPWDPNWTKWLSGDLAGDSWLQSAIQGPNHDYLVGINVDDTDNLQGFGAGMDFPTVTDGVASGGRAQAHLGWIVLVTAPTQMANPAQGATYADTTVYAKAALVNFLSARYGGSISALDAAWGAAYTSFGSEGGWGTGSGLLDEDGTCPAAQGGSCWVPTDAFTLTGATAALRQDLDDFLLAHAQRYFSTVRAVLAQAAPGVLYLGPTTLGTWSAPPRRQILEAAADTVDVLMLPSLPPDCPGCTDAQQRLDFVARYAGNKPWVNWEGYGAQADSYMAPYASAGAELATQAQRAALYGARLKTLLASADTATGTRHFVGLKWWAMYDSRGEQMNWGLLTPRDDAYDGVGATPAAGVDAWGYPSGCLPAFGCEAAYYGDFVSPVAAANWAVYSALLLP